MYLSTTLSRIADEASRAAQLAVMLEVSAYPKPGNVTRFYDFRDTRFEHFIASGVAIGPVIREAAVSGAMAGLQKVHVDELAVGRYIKDCVYETVKWHRGGNTNLGTVTLLVPLAVGYAMSRVKRNRVSADLLRQAVRKVTRSTGVEDAVNFYRAVRRAGSTSLKKIPCKTAPDVNSTTAIKEVLRRRITLYGVMKACSPWDSICREWVNGMHVTFRAGYPTMMRVYKQTGDVNVAVAHTFLTILASNPDTLVARRHGLETAKMVSKKAGNALLRGGLLSDAGREAAVKLDSELRTPDNSFNPGTTADLTASSTMVSILCGLRP